jgi:hypothetical protein
MSRESFEEQTRKMHKSEKVAPQPPGGLPDEHQVYYTVACSDRQKKQDDPKKEPCELVLDRTQMHKLAILHAANTVEQAPRFLTQGRKAAIKWADRLEKTKENFRASLPLSAVVHIGGLVEAHPVPTTKTHHHPVVDEKQEQQHRKKKTQKEKMRMVSDR